MRAMLIPLDGGPPVEIARDITLVGRKEFCDLQLDHKSISKVHCVLVKTDGLLLLRDLGSTNGTRVNGQHVRRAHLLPNDKLSIAALTYRVYLGPDDAPDLGEHEHTQQIGVDEEDRLLQLSSVDSGYDEGPQPRFNSLPDVYPDNSR